MRVITQKQVGEASEVLEVAEVPKPEPEPGQVLVKVEAAGVNPADFAVSAGYYPLLGEPPFTLGWDVAGTVEAVGTGVSRLSAGDQVFGMPAFPGEGRTHAEYVAVSAGELAFRPDALSVAEAGALPLAGLTAYQALAGIARLRPGQRVLVHRAAGGVGHLAVQIAKALGAHVIATASAAKHEFVRSLGADEVIDYRSTDYTEVLADLDVVFDLVAGENGPRSASVLKKGGLLISALPANMGLDRDEAAALGIRLVPVNVRPSAHDLERLAEMAGRGELKVRVDEELPLTDAARAYALAGSGTVTGKIVLIP
ncbi:NADP-dependent oxidoreductase [Actinocorallia aurantiaca]|uniref:NADP-dependent oxidoreductase n=1 Tax=Actinocorallia aurantiaca TaxID=46204 RepID=A0ABN3TZL7_9ACTN